MADKRGNEKPDCSLVLICCVLHLCALFLLQWFVRVVALGLGVSGPSTSDGFGMMIIGLGLVLVGLLTTPLFGFLWATLAFKYLNSDGSGVTQGGLCGVCGYDVRAASGGRCSECGAAIGTRSLTRLEQLNVRREEWSGRFSRAVPVIVLGVVVVGIVVVVIREIQM